MSKQKESQFGALPIVIVILGAAIWCGVSSLHGQAEADKMTAKMREELVGKTVEVTSGDIVRTNVKLQLTVADVIVYNTFLNSPLNATASGTLIVSPALGCKNITYLEKGFGGIKYSCINQVMTSLDDFHFEAYGTDVDVVIEDVKIVP